MRAVLLMNSSMQPEGSSKKTVHQGLGQTLVVEEKGGTRTGWK